MGTSALTPYRVTINSTLLQSSAEKLLAHAESPQSLAEFLNWTSPPELLAAGFVPQADSGKLITLMQENKLRKQLKNKRLSRGFKDLIQPRKGLKGWWQRQFHDPKETKLACGYQIMEFLKNSPRFALLSALHDTLLAYTSTTTAHPADLTEVYTEVNPIALMIANDDFVMAGQLVQALSQPLSKVNPTFIIQHLYNQVLAYDQTYNSAYYFA